MARRARSAALASAMMGAVMLAVVGARTTRADVRVYARLPSALPSLVLLAMTLLKVAVPLLMRKQQPSLAVVEGMNLAHSLSWGGCVLGASCGAWPLPPHHAQAVLQRREGYRGAVFLLGRALSITLGERVRSIVDARVAVTVRVCMCVCVCVCVLL